MSFDVRLAASEARAAAAEQLVEQRINAAMAGFQAELQHLGAMALAQAQQVALQLPTSISDIPNKG